jgi:hypothetical protein
MNAKEWVNADKERQNAYNREWRARNPGRQSVYARKSKYGLDKAQQEALFSAPCGICRGTAEVIDHNHETGEVRGGLCVDCNLGLGRFKDNAELLIEAANYLGGKGGRA